MLLLTPPSFPCSGAINLTSEHKVACDGRHSSKHPRFESVPIHANVPILFPTAANQMSLWEAHKRCLNAVSPPARPLLPSNWDSEAFVPNFCTVPKLKSFLFSELIQALRGRPSRWTDRHPPTLTPTRISKTGWVSWEVGRVRSF